MNEAVFTVQRLALELIAAKRPSNEILDRLCNLVQELVPNGLAAVMRFDAKDNTLTIRNAPSLPASGLAAFGVLTPGPFAGSCGSSVYERKMVAVEDTATDPRWESLRSVAEQYEIRSSWSVPIFVGKTEIVGTFAILRSECGAPSEDQCQLLELAACLAGVVIQLENADVQARAQDALLRTIVGSTEAPTFVKELGGRYQLVNEAEVRRRGFANEDVTELRHVERAMQQDQKIESFGLLAGGIAHDFNKLLVGVMANTSMLAEDDRISEPDMLKSVLEIRLAAECAAGLTRQLLQCAGERKPARERFALGKLLAEVPDLLASGLSKKVQLRTQLDAGLPVVDADPVQIRHVLMNLILNASESFDGDEGTIDVRVSLHRNETPIGPLVSTGDHQRGDWIRVCVTDNGCGMDAATVARIFDPLFTTKTAGRGLGLAAVLEVIRSHGGCIDVESRIGSGTSFRLWLPVDCSVSEQNPVVIPGRAPVSTGKNSRRGCILVVEDDAAIGDVLCRMLKLNGYEAVLATDGQHGLAVFTEAIGRQSGDSSFDLVIMDYTMPGLNGHELAHRIRAQDADVPIVMTSGLGQVDVLAESGEQVIDSFLCKPFRPDQVQQAMDDAVKSRQLLRT
ncbi:MAG: signal transduction histidine kinase/ActR/RegA family two-component response regulator [Planctomycetota bacterium]|jgi:signal transduction histidine kinase/ActR/RegA family two-component response regulator